jgi:hypothetical protein
MDMHYASDDNLSLFIVDRTYDIGALSDYRLLF